MQNYYTFEEEDQNTRKIVQIATGRNHVMALDKKGRVYTWGENTYGQLGKIDPNAAYNKEKPVPKPQSLENELKKDIKQIYTGKFSSYAVTKDGVIFSWGKNVNNNLIWTCDDIENHIEEQEHEIQIPGKIWSPRPMPVNFTTEEGLLAKKKASIIDNTLPGTGYLDF